MDWEEDANDVVADMNKEDEQVKGGGEAARQRKADDDRRKIEQGRRDALKKVRYGGKITDKQRDALNVRPAMDSQTGTRLDYILKYAKVKNMRKPVLTIVVPNNMNSKINLMTAHYFLDPRTQRWVDPASELEHWSKKPQERFFEKTMMLNGIQYTFDVKLIDSTRSFKDKEGPDPAWQTVVGVFLDGTEWQCKKWPFEDYVRLFNSVRAFYLTYRYEKVKTRPPLINKHDIKVLEVSQENTERHYDTPQVEAFWGEVEQLLLKRNQMEHNISANAFVGATARTAKADMEKRAKEDWEAKKIYVKAKKEVVEQTMKAIEGGTVLKLTNLPSALGGGQIGMGDPTKAPKDQNPQNLLALKDGAQSAETDRLQKEYEDHQLALEDGRAYRQQEKQNEDKKKNDPNTKPIVLKNPLAQMQKAFNTKGIRDLDNEQGLATAQLVEGLMNESIANGNGHAAAGDSDDMEE